MPVPQENSFFVERESPFRNRQDACSTIKLVLCGREPVLDNGARYQLTFYAFKDIDSNTPGVRYGKNRDRVMATP
jgi:hypothetical protein